MEKIEETKTTTLLDQSSQHDGGELIKISWASLYGLIAYVSICVLILLAYIYRQAKRSIAIFTLSSAIYVTMMILFLCIIK